MSSALDMSLEDLIKNNKKSSGSSNNSRGRGRGSGPGPTRRFQNRGSNRPTPYSMGKVTIYTFHFDAFNETRVYACDSFPNLMKSRVLYVDFVIQIYFVVVFFFSDFLWISIVLADFGWRTADSSTRDGMAARFVCRSGGGLLCAAACPSVCNWDRHEVVYFQLGLWCLEWGHQGMIFVSCRFGFWWLIVYNQYVVSL